MITSVFISRGESSMSTLVFFRRIFSSLSISAIACLAVSMSVAQAESLLTENDHAGFLMAEKKPKRKGGRKPKRKPVEQEPLEATQNVSMSSRATDSLASKTSVRGVLGIMPQLKISTMVFGGGITMPYSKSIVLDGGVDYFKAGNEFVSVSLLRIGGGAAYIVSQSADSLFRVGGRAGLGIASLSVTFFDETISDSKTGICAELRATYETKLGGLLLGGELQLPIILAQGSASELLAIYGTLGMAL